MNTEEKTQVTMVKGTGGKYRWVALTALFLAIGTILRLVSPSAAGVISPNWTIAMYCLVMILIRPTFGQALGIGLVAGAIAVASSKAAVPFGNLVSEPIGALVCALLVRTNLPIKWGKVNLQPAVFSLLTTFASGFTFVTITKLVLGEQLPMNVYLYVMVPTVLTMAALNTVVTQILYFPVYKIFVKKGEE